MTSGDRVGDLGRGEGDDTCGEGCCDHRNQHLREKHTTVDRLNARADDRGTDETAEQRVRRARGQTVEPGEQVPDDGADQAGKNHLWRDEHPAVALINETARDGLRDLGREKRANEIQNRGEQHRSFRFQRAGRDGGCHRIRSVVKPVGEVEEERQHNDQQHDEGEFHRRLSFGVCVGTRGCDSLEVLPRFASRLRALNFRNCGGSGQVDTPQPARAVAR